MDNQERSRDLYSILSTLPPGDLVHARAYIDSLLTPERLRQANLSLSPLLRIPRNIREQIVDLAVSYDHDIHIEGQKNNPGLLQTCHSLRAESARLYYGRNTFKRKRSLGERELENWSKVRVGDHRKHLKRVRLGPPLHCNNGEAQKEASLLDERCGVPKGTVWVLSDDDFENDYEWWVNALGETEKREPVAEHGASRAKSVTSESGVALGPSTSGPAASWYCSSWMARKDITPEETPEDYFSQQRQGIITPESRPSPLNRRHPR